MRTYGAKWGTDFALLALTFWFDPIQRRDSLSIFAEIAWGWAMSARCALK
jgi:hypothetical protein